MSKARFAAVLTLGALACTAAPIRAQSTWYNNICSTGTFRACASAEVFLSGGGLVMNVWNMEVNDDYSSTYGGHHTITAVGLTHMFGTLLPSALTVTAQYITSLGAQTLSQWSVGKDPTVAHSIQASLGADVKQGHKEGIVGCTDPGPTSAGHVSTCQSFGSVPYVRFTFGGLSPSQLDLSQFAFSFHGQQVGPNNDLSIKASGPPSEVVPEPVTMALLGTGLAGVGILRRRRRKEPELTL